jgi:hypothetical protein
LAWAALLIFALGLVGGCATKRYGRAVPLTTTESQNYTCRELEIEIAKVTGFQEQIRTGARIDWRSVAGWLGDYGLGNSLERSDAEKSANRRMNELLLLRQQRGCLSPHTSAPPPP